MVRDVFISHSSQDSSIAKQVCDALEKSGIYCWIAPRDVLPGMYFGEAIIDAISTTRVLVLIFSSKVNNSDFVMRELERAVSRGNAILPFRIENVIPSKKIEFYVSSHQWLDAFPNNPRDYFDLLAKSLQGLLKKEPSAPEDPLPPPPKSRNTIIWNQAMGRSLSLWLSIFRQSTYKYHFSLSDGRNELVTSKTVHLTKDAYQIIHHALSTYATGDAEGIDSRFRKLGNLIYRILLPPQVQEVIDNCKDTIILNTEDATIPWELLHDHEDFLFLKRPVARIPEVFHWADEMFNNSPLPDSGMNRVLIIADPSGVLPDDKAEADMIYKLFEKRGVSCDILVGPDQCTYLNIKQKLRKSEYGIIHIVGDLVRLPERQSSAVVLANRQPFMAEEICSAFLGFPLVFLNVRHGMVESSELEEGPWGYGPINVLMMAQAFTQGSRLGRARAVIGSMWKFDQNIMDIRFSETFYKKLLDGNSLGESLRISKSRLSVEKTGFTTWNSYVLFGDPHLTLDIKPVRPAENKKAKAKKSVSPPWNDDMRVTLLGAVASMRATNWPILSSLHMLLGITYLPDGILSKAISSSGLDPNQARRVLRKALKHKGQHPNTKGFKVSKNLVSILKSAINRSASDGSGEVNEKHVLGEMLSRSTCGASIILTSLKINLKELRKMVACSDPLKDASAQDDDDLFLESGSLNVERFDPICMDALKGAVKMASLMNWTNVRTIHVFLGLLSNEKFELAKRVQTLNLDFKLRNLFIQTFQKPPGKEHRKLSLRRDLISSNASKLLREAHRHAISADRLQINEHDMIEAILRNKQGIVVHILKQAGINISKLLDYGYNNNINFH